MNPLLRAEDLHVTYGQTPALRGASLDVEPGEILALVGPSGSGKSTLLYCLAGISVPDSGTASFAGVPLSGLSDDERTDLRRTSFGFVMQFGHLVPDLSIEENVALPLLLRGANRTSALADATASLEALGLSDALGRRPGQLSGGQMQRAAVARALSGAPQVVFADEPTGALDTENGDIVMKLLTDGARAQGTTVVLVTHEKARLEEVDRVVAMRDGVVV